MLPDAPPCRRRYFAKMLVATRYWLRRQRLLAYAAVAAMRRC